MTQSLLPCPFCGSELPIFYTERDNHDGQPIGADIECRHCNGHVWGRTNLSATKQWNTRTPAPVSLEKCARAAFHADVGPANNVRADLYIPIAKAVLDAAGVSYED